MNIDNLIIDKTTKDNKSKEENVDKTAKKQRVIGRPFKKGQSGNPKGRGKGTISLLTDIKKRLKETAKKNPQEYKELIDYYWKNEKMRDLLIKMIDGLPKQSVDLKAKIESYDWGEYKD